MLIQVTLIKNLSKVFAPFDPLIPISDVTSQTWFDATLV